MDIESLLDSIPTPYGGAKRLSPWLKPIALIQYRVMKDF